MTEVQVAKEQLKIWIEQAIGGEEEAFAKIFQHYYPIGYRIALKMTNSEADAAEAVQEAFIQMHRSLHTLACSDAFYGWMRRIVISKCIRIFAKSKAIAIDPGEIASRNTKEERTYLLPDESNAYRSEQIVLYELIESMSPKLKEVIYLMYFEQLKIAEIAQRLNIPQNTVKTRLIRAREELRKKVEAFEQKEGRKLSFQVDTMFPIATGIGIKMWASFMEKWDRFFLGNAVNVAGAISLSVLALSGGIMVYADQQIQDTESKQVAKEEEKEKQLIAEMQKEEWFFPSMQYYEETVDTPLKAYYTLQYWAKDAQQMQTKTAEEVIAIKDIYQALKASKSEYYDQLDQTWIDEIEQQIKKYK